MPLFNQNQHYIKTIFIALSSLICISNTNPQEFKDEDESSLETSHILIVDDKISITYLDVDSRGLPIEKTDTYKIRYDGTIFHDLLGSVSIAGLSLPEAEALLAKRFSNYISQPKIAVSLLETATKLVLLYGEIPRVGIIPIKPNTTVAEFIIQNGGTRPEADISKIVVSKSDGSTIIFDMERFLYTNEPVNNVVLNDGDKVIVPRLSPTERLDRLSRNYILQYGNVIEIAINETSLLETNPIKPETYIIDKEGNIFHRLFGLVHIAGATVDKAQSMLKEMAKKYYREPHVTINVTKLSSRNVFVFGAVTRPGIYPIEGSIRLAEFLATIGGLTADAELRKITISRDDAKTVVFNMEKYLFNRVDKGNIYLEDGDRIIVPSKRQRFLNRFAESIRPLITFVTLTSSTILIYIYIQRL